MVTLPHPNQAPTITKTSITPVADATPPIVMVAVRGVDS